MNIGSVLKNQYFPDNDERMSNITLFLGTSYAALFVRFFLIYTIIERLFC